jgi:hypothetical protein
MESRVDRTRASTGYSTVKRRMSKTLTPRVEMFGGVARVVVLVRYGAFVELP